MGGILSMFLILLKYWANVLFYQKLILCYEEFIFFKLLLCIVSVFVLFMFMFFLGCLRNRNHQQASFKTL